MNADRTQEGAPGQGVPSRVWYLTALLAALALLLHSRGVLDWPPAAGPVRPTWWMLLVAFAVAEAVPVYLHLRRETYAFSLAEVPLLVGLAYADPVTLLVARVAGNVVGLLRSRTPPLKFAFNLGHWWLETLLAVLVWRTVLGDAGPLSTRGWLAALVVALVTDLVGAVAVGLAVFLTEGGRDAGEHARGTLISGPLQALTNASFGIVVLTVLQVDWRAGWTLIAIAIVLYGAYRSYSTLQRRNDSLEQLADFTSQVGGELRTAAVGNEIVTRVAELFRAEVVELSMDDGDEVLRLSARDGKVSDASASPRSLARLLQTAEGETVLAAEHTRNGSLRQRLVNAGLRDAVVVPLRGPRGVIGTLLAGNREAAADTFDAEEVTVLEALANHAVVALRNGRLADSLRREAAQREHEALHDGLTGLPNRRQLNDRLAWLLGGGMTLAVLLLDIDRFKEINDTLGHQMGDRLLTEVGARLRTLLPAGSFVARLGGDEFAVVLTGVDDVEAARRGADLRRILAEPITLRELPLEVDVSIGVALSPRDGHDADGLLQRAEVAMYGAKAARSGLEFYSSERDQYSPKRLALVAELRHAIETGALGVVYQPKVRLVDGVVVGAEALVRWSHPRHGFVSPTEFIPIAEHTGLMRPLTMHVLRTALGQTRRWWSQGLELGVAVNVSARTLLDATLVEDVLAMLRAVDLSPSVLTLEITESDILEDPEHASAVLQRLEGYGIHRSVDDFGTGYSSLSYLQRLPVDEMKIDKSFIDAMGSAEGQAIVGAVVDLGRRLHKRIVAEGVETEQNWHELAALGCDVAQGYLLSRPLDGDQFSAWVRAWSPPRSACSLRPASI